MLCIAGRQNTNVQKVLQQYMLGSKMQNLGDWGERVAAWWLEKQGYKIIRNHYTSRFGEIDLIAEDRGQVIFIEVKLRLGINSGLPEESVNYEKRNKMRKTILAYISSKKIEDFRVDVISISSGKNDKKLVIRHHKAISDMFIM